MNENVNYQTGNNPKQLLRRYNLIISKKVEQSHLFEIGLETAIKFLKT
jgi:hypothetical protein